MNRREHWKGVLTGLAIVFGVVEIIATVVIVIKVNGILLDIRRVTSQMTIEDVRRGMDIIQAQQEIQHKELGQ